MSDARKYMEGLVHRLLSDLERPLSSAMTAFEEQAWEVASRVMFAIDEKTKESSAAIRAERDMLDADKQMLKVHAATTSGMVTLNVGGVTYVTSVPTLLRSESSFFSKLFSGQYSQPVPHSGTIFIDRDGELFKYVLSFLRTGYLDMTRRGCGYSLTLLKSLKREFQFFDIDVLGRKETMMSTFYVFGGMSTNGLPNNYNVYRFLHKNNEDIARAQNWALLSVHPEAKGYMAFSEDNAEDMIMSGGLHMSSTPGIMQPKSISATVHGFDLKNHEWTTMPSLPRPLCDHVQLTVEGTLYVMGGLSASFEEGQAKVKTAKTMYKLDDGDEKWKDLRDLPSPISSFAACCWNRRIYVFGGVNKDDRPTNNVYCYDPPRNEWSFVAFMPVFIHEHTVTVINGVCYMVGGKVSANGVAPTSVISSIVYSFNPVTRIWIKLPSLVNARASHGAILLRGGLCVLGGYHEEANEKQKTPVRTAEIYYEGGATWNLSKDNFSTNFDRYRFGSVIVNKMIALNGFDGLIRAAQDGLKEVDGEDQCTDLTTMS